MDLSYLPQLVELAERDGGLSLTTLGSRGLAETGRMLLASVDELTNLAERAVAIGDREACRIVQTVLRRDPGNFRAETVQRLVERGGEVRVRQRGRRRGRDAANGDLDLV